MDPFTSYTHVIPTKVGIHASAAAASGQWIPAFAGMTFAPLWRAVRRSKTSAGSWAPICEGIDVAFSSSRPAKSRTDSPTRRDESDR